MRLEISFRGVRPRDEVRRRAEGLFQKLERFLDPAADATLVVGKENGDYAVDIVVTSHGDVFKAEEQDGDLRTALDRMFHTVEEALRRSKGKRIDRSRGGPRNKPDGFVPAGAAEDEDLDEALPTRG